ncbi:type I methionyl aminopeptidase [candidate division KSB3 bacterium]|uniref:Methionine aminopeptidase n=1 Tax=candidate division KSB3 bacterium TaxID=2044937 RepID=A0A2G6EAC7_9BACT|nr:MAG: type I methionyl aminopeptidase [candidate division KSB3 bacterium]PIE30799.1 MAG: type I methionyl aminopeptidase [candidate division KSB3 bacterium]
MARIHLKTPQEIELIRESSRITAQTLKFLEGECLPGISTLELDRMAETFIRDHGGTPSFKGYHGFPNSVCCSVNEEVVHGIPSSRRLKNGDVITLDTGVYKNNYHGDAAITVAVGEVSRQARQLIEITREALYLGIDQAKPGARLGDIGFAIQTLARQYHYGVVREYTGHGIGRDLHEAPHVLHYGKANSGLRLKAGMVFTIEPMLTAGSHEIRVKKDGWTAITKDRSLCAQFEHTLALTTDGAQILTLPE